MALICGDYDDDFEPDPGSIQYNNTPEGFTLLPLKRGKRCQAGNCNNFIKPGDMCVAFNRYKRAETELEERIYEHSGANGYEIPRADEHVCEECGDKFFNILDRGYGWIFPWEISETMDELIALERGQHKGVVA